MKIALKTRDERLVARIINLAHRFGCSYDDLLARRHDDTYVAAIELTGPTDALRRLGAQINKLIDDDKEYSR